MRRPLEISAERNQIETIHKLTGAFEGIASMRISQIKSQVLESKNFFDELWNIYTQIRVDSAFHYGRRSTEENVIDKELLIVITAEGGFSGDIDQRLIDAMIKEHDPATQEIIVIGHHGAIQLAQRGVSIMRYFKLPQKDENINVMPIIEFVQKYRKTTAYYQTYISLMNQKVRKIGLQAAVKELGKDITTSHEVITEENYIFEPSTYEVVDHLERSMLNIALSQIILESKLAQYASRFRAMSQANDKSKDTFEELTLQFNRSTRYQRDERLKEITSGLRKVKR